MWFDTVEKTVDTPQCPCLANPSSKKSAVCKHVGALLLGCFALNEYSQSTAYPHLFQRVNIKRFTTACEKLKEQVRFYQTWPEVIEKLHVLPPEKAPFSTKKDVIITKYEENQPKKKKKEGLEAKTVPELKEILRMKRLKVTGKKEELIKRIEEDEKRELIIHIPVAHVVQIGNDFSI